MRVVIASTFTPFRESGDRKIVRSLQRELRLRGSEVDTVFVPFDLHWPDIATQTAALRLLDLTASCGDSIDRLIAIRMPAHALRHPHKVAWFLKSREVEDFLDSKWDAAGERVRGRYYRDVMRESDEIHLRECRRVYSDSFGLADRMLAFNGVRHDRLLHVPLDPDHGFGPGPFGDHLLCDYRPDAPREFELVLRSVAYADPVVKVVVAARGDRPAPLPDLEADVRAAGLESRVRIAGVVTAAERRSLTAECSGILQVNPHEDLQGESILEACHAHKPVIALGSASGAGEFLRHRRTGFICDRDPLALGEAMTRLWRDREYGRELGRAGHAELTRLRVDWDCVIETLTA